MAAGGQSVRVSLEGNIENSLALRDELIGPAVMEGGRRQQLQTGMTVVYQAKNCLQNRRASLETYRTMFEMSKMSGDAPPRP